MHCITTDRCCLLQVPCEAHRPVMLNTHSISPQAWQQDPVLCWCFQACMPHPWCLL